MKYFLLLPALAFSFSTSPLGSQTTSANLLEEFSAISGEWSKEDGSLKVDPSPAARCRIAENLPDNYDFTLEFTRQNGDGTVIAIIPVGDVSPALEIAAWTGESHGLSRVNGLPSNNPENPTAVFPGLFENGEKQTLDVSVRSGETTSAVKAKLNGKELFDWTGDNTALDQNIVMNLPGPRALGLAVHNSNVVFHRATLRAAGAPATPIPSAKPTPPSPKSTGDDSIDLSALRSGGSPGWELFNDGGFSKSGSGVKADPSAGQGDRGAFLEDFEFEQGIIEVELEGANQPGGSFLGVVFHGVDGDTYDSVYFRPFNFGHSDPVRRSHAVQYMSHPAWPWDKLRSERNGEFEAAASPEPKPEDRFSARIEVTEKRVKVFVNNADQPCLDVERLGTNGKGKVGLWYNGIATFYNLRVEK